MNAQAVLSLVFAEEFPMVSQQQSSYKVNSPLRKKFNFQVNNSSRDNLSIYPNPAQGYINVIYNSTLTNDRLLIYTSQGALYATFALEKEQRIIKLNTEAWLSGLYFVSHQNNEKGSSNFQKILIQH